MAIYRQIHISFWQDPFVLTLTPEEKYFYLYLMTNSKTSQCGVYELPKSVIVFETGYNLDTVDKLIKKFVDYCKIDYSEETKEIYLKNWLKYNSFKSPKVRQCIDAEVNKIKCSLFKRKTMDSLSIDSGEEEEQEEEQKQKEEKEEEGKKSYQDILKEFKEICVDLPKPTKLTKERKKHINARIEGFKIGEAISWTDIFQMVQQSDFLTNRKNENRNNWKADFDWILNESNMAKILEGKYGNKIYNNGFNQPDPARLRAQQLREEFKNGCAT